MATKKDLERLDAIELEPTPPPKPAPKKGKYAFSDVPEDERPGHWKKRVVTDEQILEAIPKMHGNMTAVARSLGCSRNTIYRAVKNSRELETAFEEQRENTLDSLEEELFTQALNGNTTLLIFALKTAGYKRGYGDRSKLDVDGTFVSKEDRERNEKKDAEFLGKVLSELEGMKKKEAAAKDKPAPEKEPTS